MNFGPVSGWLDLGKFSLKIYLLPNKAKENSFPALNEWKISEYLPIKCWMNIIKEIKKVGLLVLEINRAKGRGSDGWMCRWE